MSTGRWTKAIIFCNDRYHNGYDDDCYNGCAPAWMKPLYPTARISMERVTYPQKVKPGQCNYKVEKLGAVLIPNGLTMTAAINYARRKFPKATDYRLKNRFGEFVSSGNSF